MSTGPSPTVSTRADRVGHAREQTMAMRLSLAIGLLMLAGKWNAYRITNSAAILSDAAESVVHVVAVAFAAYSLWLSLRPADPGHPYGHDKISFFSAGFEGLLIVIAAIYIVYEATTRWLEGLELRNLGAGLWWIGVAAIVNLGLGLYLVWRGKRSRSLILIANGKHVLTDSWTSLGVIVGVVLVLWTGWKPFDPILAIVVALNIVWSGWMLMRQSVRGLMDESDPEINRRLVAVLDEETSRKRLEYHALRHRNSGVGLWIDFHLLFPADTSIEVAHREATAIEAAIQASMPGPVTVTTHLEPIERHGEAHQDLAGETH
jgi:cation diffusion facilitator family transporter